MQTSVLTAVLLPIALAIVMLGLGLSLTLADFRRVLLYPRAVFAGLLAQVVILPLLCFGIATSFGLAPELAVGLMLLAASPGGATANLFSHLARGDVALNITLTAVNSVISLFTLPLILNFALIHFMGAENSVPLQFSKILQVFFIVLGPVSVGMVIRAKRPQLAARLDRAVRVLSALVLVVIVAATMIKEREHIVSFFAQVGLPALVFNLSSMAVGFFLPLALRLERRQSVAIALEIGVHNSTLAIAIASAPSLLNNSVMAIPAAVYSLIMLVTAGLFGMLVSRRMALPEGSVAT
ncbi:MAG: bile acid:sodium symporter family protein [Archangium sp.]|nr:bile acid:sodium symporter family protein [Archangium sp.]